MTPLSLRSSQTLFKLPPPTKVALLNPGNPGTTLSPAGFVGNPGGPFLNPKDSYNCPSQGLIKTQLLTNKHIVEVFVHLDEAKSEKELYEITFNRAYDHTSNAIALFKGKTKLSKNAGEGIRQGKDNVGGIR